MTNTPSKEEVAALEWLEARYPQATGRGEPYWIDGSRKPVAELLASYAAEQGEMKSAIISAQAGVLFLRDAQLTSLREGLRRIADATNLEMTPKLEWVHDEAKALLAEKKESLDGPCGVLPVSHYILRDTCLAEKK